MGKTLTEFNVVPIENYSEFLSHLLNDSFISDLKNATIAKTLELGLVPPAGTEFPRLDDKKFYRAAIEKDAKSVATSNGPVIIMLSADEVLGEELPLREGEVLPKEGMVRFYSDFVLIYSNNAIVKGALYGWLSPRTSKARQSPS